MKICAIPAGTGGVSFYRIKQPFRKLQEDGHDIFIFNSDEHDGNRLHQQQAYADIIIYQCPWSEGMLQSAKLIKKGNAFGSKMKIVVELDDNLFNVDPWNEKYNMFGVEEKKITVSKNDKETQENFIKNAKNESWCRSRKNKDGSMDFDMWRDGHCNFNIKENMAKYKATSELLNIVDLITVTTSELGKQIRKIAPSTNIAVLPNYVDFDRWLPMEDNDTNEIRIGWQGGSAHFDDMRLIIKDLEKIHKKYNSGKNKKVRFCFMGIQYTSLFELFGDQVDYYPWHGDIETYPLLVREMKLDIALAPLKDTVFNRGKSPLKWCEYSAMKVPTIASEIVYSSYIDHGKTGIIAKKGEWYDCIDDLIQNKDKRALISEKAYNRVKFKYSESNRLLWLNAMNQLMK
jgi:glycosyltransferase involved in cell wall biosynthesis